MTELIVRSARVVVDGEVKPASVHVKAGRIVKVAEPADVPAGAPVHDVGARVVMAGVVDSHVHVNEPGRTEWEGFHTATRSAAAGGVTTLVDMPLNSIPATTSVKALRTKAEALHGRGFIDVGLWGGVVPGNAGELVDMVREGALGFKCFMVDSGVAEFAFVGEADLERAMTVLATTRAPLLVHAEVPGPLDEAKRQLDAEPLRDLRSYWRYVRSRPKAAEDQAIAQLVALCSKTRARTHVVHLSSATALDTLRHARDLGLPFSAETTPHYLRLAAEDIPDGRTEFKCAPPIREQANREALWQGLHDGTLSMVVTDHSPCTPELKKFELGDFDGAWGGIASLQFGLPLVWTEARARGVSLGQLSRWLSEAPAALAGVSARKGAVAVGRDADLVVWDPDASFTVTKERILHRHPVTPYLGQSLFGVVHETFVRGQRVFGEGQVAERPMGQWLRGVS
jgi:allantoinase